MRVLVVYDLNWNDKYSGNNLLSNWFEGFPAEFATIYCQPGLPFNKVCKHYYQITDMEMAKSIFSIKRAGHRLAITENDVPVIDPRRQGLYKPVKRLSYHFKNIVKLIEDTIWMCGRLDKKGIEKFVKDFNPDIVFCGILAEPKVMRLHRVIRQYTKAPFVAFTGDREVGMGFYNLSPFFWLRQVLINNYFRHNAHLYSHYFMHSDVQAAEYRSKYGINTSTLFKCADFEETVPLREKKINTPITMVYAGHLFYNRWVALSEIAKSIKEINKDSVKIILNIYTPDEILPKYTRFLNDDYFAYIKGSVSSDELSNIYKNADLALQVESYDKEFKAFTQYSFSTKIIDLLACSCAIFALGWDGHCGFNYLKKNDAAICVESYRDILPALENIVSHPEIINEYSIKAYNCGKRNHSRTVVHNQIMDTFKEVIKITS